MAFFSLLCRIERVGTLTGNERERTKTAERLFGDVVPNHLALNGFIKLVIVGHFLLVSEVVGARFGGFPKVAGEDVGIVSDEVEITVLEAEKVGMVITLIGACRVEHVDIDAEQAFRGNRDGIFGNCEIGAIGAEKDAIVLAVKQIAVGGTPIDGERREHIGSVVAKVNFFIDIGHEVLYAVLVEVALKNLVVEDVLEGLLVGS